MCSVRDFLNAVENVNHKKKEGGEEEMEEKAKNRNLLNTRLKSKGK